MVELAVELVEFGLKAVGGRLHVLSGFGTFVRMRVRNPYSQSSVSDGLLTTKAPNCASYFTGITEEA